MCDKLSSNEYVSYKDEPFEFLLVAQSPFTSFQPDGLEDWIRDLGLTFKGFDGNSDQGCTKLLVEGTYPKFQELSTKVPLHVLPLNAVPDIMEGWLVALSVAGQLIYPHRTKNQ